MTQLQPGDRAPARVLVDTGHTPWRIPHTGLLHLQFRRFAGCPICTLHLASFAHRHEELVAAGIQEIVVFRASREAVAAFHGTVPFPLVADELGALYQDFGVRSSLRAAIAPRAWAQALIDLGQGQPLPKPETASAALIHPADLLIAPDGRVVDAHYGSDAQDAWSVDDLLERASGRAA